MATAKLTQVQRLINWFNSGRPISEVQAEKTLKIKNLRARISELRNIGWSFELTTNRAGNTAWVAL